jgi:mono/diheme cytochrome c family protein
MITSHGKCTPLISLFIVLFSYSCTNYTIPGDDPPGDPGDLLLQECPEDEVTYEGEIVSILQEHCIACHNSGSPAGGYDYSDYDMTLASIAEGSLQGSISGTGDWSPMPPGNFLDECSIRMIDAWIVTLDLEGIVIPVDDPGNGLNSTCDPDTVYFRNTVLPLVVSSCGTRGCHDRESHRDGIILTDYASIITTGKIKPGDPGDSEFFESLTDKDDDLMPPPPQNPLSEEQISLLERWILQGAKDNQCVEGCDTSDITFSAAIWPIMETYCNGCHTSGSPAGGVIIEDYDDVVTLANEGSLMGTIRYEAGYNPMPTNQKLDPCRIDLIQQWIQKGYPE